ncbi:hypothetical protein Pmani_030250, partial [Petrolisthes manimaculis]
MQVKEMLHVCEVKNMRREMMYVCRKRIMQGTEEKEEANEVLCERDYHLNELRVGRRRS